MFYELISINVDVFARRLQVQERMTPSNRGSASRIEPKGVAVVLEGTHLCTMMRGVMKYGARMTTLAMFPSERTLQLVGRNFSIISVLVQDLFNFRRCI